MLYTAAVLQRAWTAHWWYPSDAGVVQWQNGSFPSFIRGFDSLHPLQFFILNSLKKTQNPPFSLESGFFIVSPNITGYHRNSIY